MLLGQLINEVINISVVAQKQSPMVFAVQQTIVIPQFFFDKVVDVSVVLRWSMSLLCRLCSPQVQFASSSLS